MFRVLIPQDISACAKDFLKGKGYEVQVGPGFDEATLQREIPNCDAVIARTAVYSRETISKAGSRLKIIARHGVGVDNIDLEQAKKQGVWVSVAKGANSTSVAEHTMTLLLAASKKLIEFDRGTKEGRFQIRNQMHGSEVTGKTLAIIGFGAIGRKVASMAHNGFGMRIHAYDIFKPQNIPDYVAWHDQLDEIYALADAVTYHVPLTPETKNMACSDTIAKMKDGVILINCARGGIINEAELVRALETGKVGAAGMDVFEEEPPKLENPLLHVKNLVLTPHNAALTNEAAAAMAMMSAKAVDDVLSGRRPDYPVFEL